MTFVNSRKGTHFWNGKLFRFRVGPGVYSLDSSRQSVEEWTRLSLSFSPSRVCNKFYRRNFYGRAEVSKDLDTPRRSKYTRLLPLRLSLRVRSIFTKRLT